MWKYCNQKHCDEFMLSLNLISDKFLPEKRLKYLYILSNNSMKHYKSFDIEKHNGSKRNILAPDYLLKSVQLNLTKNCLNNIPISKYAKAYFKGADILENANPHLNKKIILKMDIKDFFSNITFMMIYNKVFSNIYYPPAIRTVLVNICTYDGYLPQGAPTSPVISNIIMQPFDEYIGKWCEEKNITYTRYCDDLTFSGDFNTNLVKNKVSSFLETIGFNINHKKTKIIYNNKRQIITGIVVNKKIQTPKTYRKKIRQEIHYCKKYGVILHLKRVNINIPIQKYLQSLLGKINFILHINPHDNEFIIAKSFIINQIKNCT